MSKVEQKPYVIYLAEIIYKSIVDIKKKNPDISNIDAIEGFIGTVTYNNISSGISTSTGVLVLVLVLI